MKKLIISQIWLFVLCAIVQTSAQDIILLKVNSINPDGSLAEKDLQFEIHNNSKMYFLVNGKRKSDFFELGLQPLETMDSGVEITGYDILSEHADFDQFGIVDMRHMDIAARKAALGVDYPLLAIMGTEGDTKNIQMFKAEIIKGELTKNNVKINSQETASSNSKVTFQVSKEENALFEFLGDKVRLLLSESVVGTMELKYLEKEEKSRGAIFHYYSVKGMGYDLLILVDLNNTDLKTRKEHFKTETLHLIGLRDEKSGKINEASIKLIEGELSSIIKPEVVKTTSEIQDELTVLFKSMRNDFKEDINNPRREDEYNRNICSIQLALGSMSRLHGEITTYDNGIVFYSNHMKKGHDEIEKALESYSSSEGYKVETIRKTSEAYHYVVKENYGKTIGFLKLYQTSGVWAFNASLPLYGLETDIRRFFIYAENHFKDLDKILKEEDEDGGMYTTKEKVNYTVEPILSILKKAESSFLFLDYRLCDLEAVKYQVGNMNLSFTGYKRTFNELEKDGIQYAFEDAEGEIITIKVSYASNTNLNTNVIIDHKMNFMKEVIEGMDASSKETSSYRTNQKIAYDDYEFKEDIIHPTSAPYLPFSGKYEGDDLMSLIGRHYKDPAIQNWMNQPGFKVGFTKFETAEGGLVYVDNEANGIELRFREDKLYSMQFYIPNYKKELPLDVTTNPISLDNNKYVEFLSHDNDYSFQISEGHRLRFEVYQNKVHRMTIW